jgi:tRNA(Ile)-lysidine synthetase-like protein
MIADLAAAGGTGASLDLPRALIVRRGYKSLRFETGQGKVLRPGSAAAAEVAPGTPRPHAAKELAVPGETRWGTWTFEARVLEGKHIWEELMDLSGCLWIPEFDDPPADSHERMRVFIRQLREIDPEPVEYLDFDRIAGKKLTVRGRVPGDRFTPLGAPGQTKLKNFFIRRKVPRTERDGIPLIVAGDRVLVVARLAVSDDARLTEDTRRILKISATAQNG